MTRPVATSKLLLLEDRRGGSTVDGPTPVRRYRLARLSHEAATAEAHDRFAYLRRAHD